VLAACGGAQEGARERRSVGTTFGDDLAFLRQHLPDLVVLSRGEARVAVAPLYQGRVMTSSARGEGGASCGWINRALVASGERQPHMNAFGGEDRFWLGPEGGQFGLYFAPGAPFDLEHWQVPEAIDWGGWEISERSDVSVALRRDMELVNASGTRFSIRADRTVRMIDPAAVGGSAVAGVDAVAYESVNGILNVGTEPWREETGLVSIWILSMYPPSPATTVVIPFRRDGEGRIVNDAYFGEVPADRLRVDEASGVLFFRADGQRRSKIGVGPGRAMPVAGSWDAERGVLTIVRYTLREGETRYVNSMWEVQAEPYGGDVVNSYNDGPLGPGQPPLGPFYELESSSVAGSLASGRRLEHTHSTLHAEGDRAALDAIAREALGVGLDAIEGALRAP
jgi:hypothetical protein